MTGAEGKLDVTPLSPAHGPYTIDWEALYLAKVAGVDPKSDLAVVYIEKDRPVNIVALGDSDELEVGSWVVAIGHPIPRFSEKDNRFMFNRHELTVTVGVVSAKGRWDRYFGKEDESPVFQDYIQTDAAINGGNSGGPLFDIHGQVVGVNSASLGDTGISLAIPINLAEKIANDLIIHGRVIRAYLGLVPQAIDEDLAIALGLSSTNGVLVARVTDDTPAGKAGLQNGDIITKFDGMTVSEVNKFRMMVADAKIGKKVDIDILRNGEKKTLTAELKEFSGKDLVTPVSVPVSAHWLGVNVKEKKNQGLMVVDIEEYSPAYRSKLRKGDIILEVNGEAVKDWDDYKEIAKKLEDEQHIRFYVKRGNTNLFIGIINY